MVNKGKTAAEPEVAFQDTLVVWVRARLFLPAGDRSVQEVRRLVGRRGLRWCP